MAKYVLIAFEDDSAADAFVAALPQTGVFFDHNAGAEGGVYGYVDPAKTFVRAIWKKPTVFCECMDSKPYPKDRGLGRGEKWKWYACTKCARATAGWAAGEGFFTALGRNLLPVSWRAPEYRGDKGVLSGHVYDAEKEQWQNVVTGVYANAPLQGAPQGPHAWQYVKTEDSVK